MDRHPIGTAAKPARPRYNPHLFPLERKKAGEEVIALTAEQMLGG